MYEVNLKQAVIDNNLSCNLLFCHHQSETLRDLFVLHGEMRADGFLSNIGHEIKVVQSYKHTSLRSVSCDILLGIGVGYQDLFTFANFSDPPLYFLTWILPRV